MEQYEPASGGLNHSPADTTFGVNTGHGLESRGATQGNERFLDDLL